MVGTDLTGIDDEEPDDAYRFIMRFSWDGELLWNSCARSCRVTRRRPLVNSSARLPARAGIVDTLDCTPVAILRSSTIRARLEDDPLSPLPESCGFSESRWREGF